MIEQGIYFALGCIVTALLALLFAPVFWRRALRLTRQRLALQVPLSMQEILAQRDQIRAEFAVERLRIEQAMEAVQASKAEDMAEIGRRSMQAATLADEIARLHENEKTHQADIEFLRREAAEGAGERPAAPLVLHEEDEGGDGRWRERAENALTQNARLRGELDALRATVAALKTRSMGLEMRLTEAERNGAAGDGEGSLRARLETAVGQAARHEAAGLSVRRELDEAKKHVRHLEDQLEAGKSGHGEARDARRAAAFVDSAADKLELLTAENAALQSALTAARQSGAPAPGSDEDAGLRETIHALGVAVAKLTRQAREGAGPRADEKPRLPRTDVEVRPVGVA